MTFADSNNQHFPRSRAAIRRWCSGCVAKVTRTLFLFAVPALLVGCESQEPDLPPVVELKPRKEVQSTVGGGWPPDDRRHDEYVGSQRCSECHNEVCDSFSQHPMGRSVAMQNQLAKELLNSLPTTIVRGNRRYSVAVNEGRMTQSESLSAADGVVLYHQTCDIDFAVGSGTRGYTFVTDQQGSLFQHPLTWYSQKGRWDLSPGYDQEKHPRFGRQISDACIACHAGRMNVDLSSAHKFTSPLFAEQSIGCERCHGPGARHIAFHDSSVESLQADPIVNPARLSPERRDSVCLQCHLHGKDRILKSERTDFDFRPGDLVSDIWVVFVEESNDSFNAVSQAEQMMQSQCYVVTGGRMGCISCHDSHSVPQATERPEFYRSRCLECHQEEEACALGVAERKKVSSKDSCIQCHMPGRETSDIPHTAQTDHRILRDPASTNEDGRKGVSLTLFAPDSFPVSQPEAQRAFALMQSKEMYGSASTALARDVLSGLTPFISADSRDVAAIDAASLACIRLRRPGPATALAQQGLAVSPHNESLLANLADVATHTGNPEDALESVDRILELRPWNIAMESRRAALLAELNRTEQAVESARRALEINPLHHSSRRLLIDLLESSGARDEAKQQRELLNKLIETLDRPLQESVEAE